MSLAEIRFGIELVDDASRRRDLTDWLTHRVRPMFEQRGYAITEDVIVRWRLLVEEGRKVAHTFSQPRSRHCRKRTAKRLTVVTRDVSEFEAARVAVCNPWISDGNYDK